jgi:hypothetical protein
MTLRDILLKPVRELWTWLGHVLKRLKRRE